MRWVNLYDIKRPWRNNIKRSAKTAKTRKLVSDKYNRHNERIVKTKFNNVEHMKRIRRTKINESEEVRRNNANDQMTQNNGHEHNAKKGEANLGNVTPFEAVSTASLWTT